MRCWSLLNVVRPLLANRRCLEYKFAGLRVVSLPLDRRGTLEVAAGRQHAQGERALLAAYYE